MDHAQIAHESGHATVAKHLGYRASITNFGGPRTDFDPPIEGMPREHRLLIWAAGRAALELMGADNPYEGFAGDESNMRRLCGSEEEIARYVKDAKQIIKDNRGKWCAIRDKLHQRYGLDEQQKLDQIEIDQIWDQK
jgi:hypothetical protein